MSPPTQRHHAARKSVFISAARRITGTRALLCDIFSRYVEAAAAVFCLSFVCAVPRATARDVGFGGGGCGCGSHKQSVLPVSLGESSRYLVAEHAVHFDIRGVDATT